MKKFVDVIVPLPIANQYTYSLPQEMEEMVQIGCRVVVPFGKKKFYTAIVTNVHYAAPEGYETKDIAEVLDSSPVLLPKQYEFWQWLAEYYLAEERACQYKCAKDRIGFLHRFAINKYFA